MATPGQNTQQTILNVAQELFCQKGYHNTSIADIANGCQLSKASLYHHIISKEALLCDIIKRAHQQLRDEVLTPVLTNPTLSHLSMEQLLELLNEPARKNNVFLLMRLRIDLNSEESQYAKRALDDYFADWDNTLHEVFSEQTDLTARRCHVDNMLSLVHGAVTFSALQNNVNKLNHAKRLVQNFKTST